MPGDYEHLKIQDVGMRSVYSGLSPYVNTRQEADKVTGKQDSVACHVTGGYRQGVATDSESLLGLIFLNFYSRQNKDTKNSYVLINKL